jgi:hypothetical protein
LSSRPERSVVEGSAVFFPTPEKAAEPARNPS